MNLKKKRTVNIYIYILKCFKSISLGSKIVVQWRTFFLLNIILITLCNAKKRLVHIPPTDAKVFRKPFLMLQIITFTTKIKSSSASIFVPFIVLIFLKRKSAFLMGINWQDNNTSNRKCAKRTVKSFRRRIW